MKKTLLKPSKLLAIIPIISAPISAIANDTVTGIEAKVIVQNTFVFTKDADLDFGTISAKADATGANVSFVVISPDPAITAASTSNAPSFLNIVLPGAPAAFSVSQVAPDTALTITFPSAITVSEVAAGTSADFTVDSWEAYIVNGANPNSVYDPNSPNLTSDATGNITFNVGATLRTDATDTTAGANGSYPEGDYLGTFNLTINY